jgi:hypothetical protein
MDGQYFPLQNERKVPRGTASDFINAINAQMVWMEHQKKPEEAVRLFYGGSFGVFRAVRISPDGADFLRIVVRSEDDHLHSIIAPLSQCSIMLSIVVPSAKEPEEKIILGFAETDQR